MESSVLIHKSPFRLAAHWICFLCCTLLLYGRKKYRYYGRMSDFALRNTIKHVELFAIYI